MIVGKQAAMYKHPCTYCTFSLDEYKEDAEFSLHTIGSLTELNKVTKASVILHTEFTIHHSLLFVVKGTVKVFLGYFLAGRQLLTISSISL